MGKHPASVKLQNIPIILKISHTQAYKPFLKGLLPNSILLRLSILIEVGTQLLGVFLVSSCKAQLHDTLIEAH